jgi:hypothetical protein
MVVCWLAKIGCQFGVRLGGVCGSLVNYISRLNLDGLEAEILLHTRDFCPG